MGRPAGQLSEPRPMIRSESRNGTLRIKIRWFSRTRIPFLTLSYSHYIAGWRIFNAKPPSCGKQHPAVPFRGSSAIAIISQQMDR